MPVAWFSFYCRFTLSISIERPSRAWRNWHRMRIEYALHERVEWHFCDASDPGDEPDLISGTNKQWSQFDVLRARVGVCVCGVYSSRSSLTSELRCPRELFYGWYKSSREDTRVLYVLCADRRMFHSTCPSCECGRSQSWEALDKVQAHTQTHTPSRKSKRT